MPKKALTAKKLRNMKFVVTMKKEDKLLCFIDMRLEIAALRALFEGGVWQETVNGVTFSIAEDGK